MANRKINELVTRTPSLTDLLLVGDPSSGYSYKCTVTSLADIIQTDIADAYVTIDTTQTITGAKTFTNVITATSVANTPTDPDKFLTLNASNQVTYRTGSQVLSDIGGADASNVVTITGSEVITGSKTFTVSQNFNKPLNIKQDASFNLLTGYTAIGADSGGVYLKPSASVHAYLVLSSLTTTRNFTFPDSTGTLALTSDLSSYVPTSRTLTINGTSYDLSANRTWSVGTVTSVALSVPTGLSVSGTPITSSGTLAVSLQSGYSIPTTANQANWDSAYNDKINSAAVTGTTTKTLTLTQQDGGTVTASWSDLNTDAVTSVFGRTGAVVATEGDYSLTQLSDVTITSPSNGQVLKYNGTTWVNDTDANTGTVTSVGLSAPTGFSVTNSPVTSSGTLTLSFASGYSLPTTASQTNWDSAYTNRITSLTTTGSSGAATLVSNTLNIPNYTLAGLGGVSGSGTTNYIPKFTSSSAIGNSVVYDASGSIGIGTSSPDTKFQVQDGFISTYHNANVNDAGYGIQFYTNGGGSRNTIASISPSQVGTARSGNLYFATSNAGAPVTKMTLDNSGNLGVGITPAAKLDVSASSGTLFRAEIAGVAQLNIGNGGGSTNYYDANTQIFRLGNGTEQMRLNSTGLGIGTSSPGNKLSVTGAANMRDYLLIDNSQSYFGDNGVIGGGAADGNTLIQYYTTKNLIFKQSGTERMRLDASGNLGLGVTPSAWGSTRTAIQLRNGTSFSDIVNYAAVGQNWYHDGTGDKYIANGYATRYYTGAGTHVWNIAPSGTAGTAISFTQAMTLDASGRLGIGTSSPTEKLDVAGTQRLTVADGSISNYYNSTSSSNILIPYLNSTYGMYLQSRNAAGSANIKMSIQSSSLLLNPDGGNVGIGTTSPSEKLEVNGNIKTAAPSGGTAKPWKLGEAGVAVGGANSTAVRVEIDGTTYYLLTAYLP